MKSYKELDKVIKYVVQQIALKADHLVANTSARPYDEPDLTVWPRREQLNSLLVREVGYEFEVNDAPAISVETNLIAPER